jgi:Tol biopolymer transport system component
MVIHRRRLRRPLVWIPLLVTFVALGAPRAVATFPGPVGRIAFIDVTGEIYAVNPDGTGLTQLTDLPRREVAFDQVWSADGTRIVFSSNQTRNFGVFVMRADGTHVREVTDARHFDDFWTTWFPGGRKIAFSRCLRTGEGCALFTVRVDGSHLQQMTPYHHDVFDVAASVSPDGSQIALTRTLARGVFSQIIVMNADGTGAHHITPARLEAFVAEWSPDGERLIYSNACCKYNSKIFVSAADGSGRVRLTHPPFPHDDTFPVFSPDANRIAFQTDRRAPKPCCNVFVADADGRGLTPITPHGGGAGEPDWGTAPLVNGATTLGDLPALERAAARAGRSSIRPGACRGLVELTYLAGGCPLRG